MPGSSPVISVARDVAGHSDGVGSDKWCAALSYVDTVAKALVTQLPRGTRIFLTADHGMVNVEEKIVLGHDNDLLTSIETIAGEPRARHLYLSADADSATARSEVAQQWRDFLGAKADVFTREEPDESAARDGVVGRAKVPSWDEIMFGAGAAKKDDASDEDEFN